MPTIKSGIIEGGPDRLKDTRSINCVVNEAGERPVHIIYVHGMAAPGAGASAAFRDQLCAHLDGGCKDAAPQFSRSVRFDVGDRPKDAKLANSPIWANDLEWAASRPFVDRYIFKRTRGGAVVVDEVNWWPLLFPLKCRFLLVPETNLSGADRTHLKLCASKCSPYYPWLSQEQLDEILSRRPKSGGGARLNAALKQQVMNWGLADAVMAVGPMRVYYRRAMKAAFQYAAHFNDMRLDEQEFVVISESLGSFAVMDAFGDGHALVLVSVMKQTYDLYFFANQFVLLELSRIENLESSPETNRSVAEASAVVPASPINLLQAWAAKTGVPINGVSAKASQILAFNDPSDMLTFDVPAISGAKVVNLYGRNGCDFLGWIENPITAHTGYSRNKHVLATMFR